MLSSGQWSLIRLTYWPLTTDIYFYLEFLMKRAGLMRAVITSAIFYLVGLLPLTACAQIVHVLPYVQPGDGRTLDGTDVKVIQWLTDQTPGDFVVEFQAPGGPMRRVQPKRVSLDFDKLSPQMDKGKGAKTDSKEQADEPEDSQAAEKATKKAKKKKKEKAAAADPNAPKEPKMPSMHETSHHYFKYTANLEGLPFNSNILYRVKQGNKVIREATFRSRATADKTARCVLVGDMANGSLYQREIAYRISQQKPEFLVALGDIVYPRGRLSEYMHHFWNVYNDIREAGLKTGAADGPNPGLRRARQSRCLRQAGQLSRRPGGILFLFDSEERSRPRSLDHAHYPSRRSGDQIPPGHGRWLSLYRHVFVRLWLRPFRRHQRQPAFRRPSLYQMAQAGSDNDQG